MDGFLARAVRSAFRPLALVVMAAAIFALVVAGPFDTYANLGVWDRVVYWTFVVVYSNFVGRLARTFTEDRIPPDRIFLTDLVLVSALAVLFTPPLHLLNSVMVFDRAPGFWILLAYVTGLGAAIAIARRSLPGFEEYGYFHQPRPIPRGAESDPVPPLLRRLPDGFAGPILRLSADDHFVEVVAPEDRHKVRMRLADAIREMDGMPGFVTHRSHWVASEAVRSARRAQGRVVLELVNGDTVPVSRKYISDIESHGLI